MDNFDIKSMNIPQSRPEIISLIRFLSTCLDVSTAILVGLDSDGRVNFINELGARVLGYKREEIVGKEWIPNFIPPGSRAEVEETFKKVFSGSGTFPEFVENPILTSGGNVRQILWRNAIVTDEAGKISSSVSSGEDVTQLRETIRKNSVLFKRIEFILNSTKTNLDIIDAEYNLLYVDPAWQAIYGPPKDKKCYEYFAERSSACPGCGIPIALKTMKTVVTEESLPKEGDRPIEVITVPFQEDGKWFVAELNMDITERKKMEEQVKYLQAKYENLVEQLPYGALIVQDNVIKFVNEGICSITGYSKNELIEKDYSELISIDNDGGKKRCTAPLMCEIDMRNKSGDLRHIKISVSAMAYDGNPADLVVVEDITVQRETEKKLLDSEKRYRQLYEGSRDGFVLCDLNWMIKEFNPNYSHIAGYDSETLKNKSIYDITPEKWHKLQNDIKDKQVMIRGYSDLYEKEYVRSDGSVIPVEARAYLLKDEKDNPVGLWAFVRDISERKRSESKIRMIQLQQEALLNNIPDMAWLKDKEDRIIAVNEPFGKACGHDYRTLRGKTDLDLWPKELAEKYRRDDSEVMRSCQRKIVEEPLTDSEGRTRWIETIKTPIFNEHGDVIGTTGIARDITTRKIAEEEIKRTVEDLKMFKEITIGREIRMLELKKEINNLNRELGRPEPFDLTALNDGMV